MAPVLELKGLTKRFGGLVAVNSVDFSLEEGRIVSIIGPNGAGKTTIFNMITGVYKPDGGTLPLWRARTCENNDLGICFNSAWASARDRKSRFFWSSRSNSIRASAVSPNLASAAAT